jgi:hypothetical protein
LLREQDTPPLGEEAETPEPGIHIPCRGYGFRACAKGRIPE